ncbi:MAG: hypothetical protein IPK32_22645 [Verrucomicrobiaceae bacterium]|nr:hypothetical protein [Verrucomicrobiaceae bacterium]
MSFEEEFGICIPDSAAEKMRTPQHVIDFVVQERRRVQHLDTRTILVNAFAGLGYKQVPADKSLNELFADHRISHWKELGKRLAPFSIPRNIPHGPGGKVAGWSFLAGVVCLFAGQWMLAALCMVAFLGGWIWADRTYRIPESVDTLEKLAAHLTCPVPESEVASKVKQIVMEQLGLKEEAYGEDKRFIEDFGID